MLFEILADVFFRATFHGVVVMVMLGCHFSKQAQHLVKFWEIALFFHTNASRR